MSRLKLSTPAINTHQRPERQPLVSIGLPVFNGESFLEEAIQSIVDQTETDWELILADNASRDGTEDICREWSERDERIRWVRTQHHTGAAGNFNRAFSLSRGRYFKWAAHDDLIAPTYIEACLQILRNDPSVVLAHSDMVEIDAGGEVTGPLESRIQDMDSTSATERFRGAISLEHGCFDVFGLIRREALKRTRLIAPYLGSDRVLLAELALQGRMERVPEALFQSREHPERSIRIGTDLARAQWFGAVPGTGTGSQRLRPNWRRLKEVRAALGRADVPFGVRLSCKTAILAWAFERSGSLYRELVGRSRPGDIAEKEPPPASPEVAPLAALEPRQEPAAKSA